MSDDPERLAEPLTAEEPWTDDDLATLRKNVADQYRQGYPNPFAASFLATIDTLATRLAAAEERVQWQADEFGRTSVALATENQAMREALTIIGRIHAHPARIARDALASLPPTPEAGT